MTDSQSFIIFLRGVNTEDYKNIEDEFNERLLESVSTQDPYRTDKVKYDIIPPIFTSLNKWTKNTNIFCWNCDFTFNTLPVFIPLSIKYVDNDKYNISVYGNFCSFPCAARHIVEHMDSDLLDNLIKLYEIFHNKQISKINPSPRRHIMLKYGGYITDEQYLNSIKKLLIDVQSNDNIKREYTQKFNIEKESDEEEEQDSIWDITPNPICPMCSEQNIS
uniref:MYM-type domain-containing protein n=1 Tax=viral metagenome TaxID=1070528 RepID=A0A6C0LM21_9ZZZZ